MATNADDTTTTDDGPVTEEDLKKLKYPDVETEPKSEEDEIDENEEDEEDEDTGEEEDGQTDDSTEEDSEEESDDEESEDDDDEEFVKEYPHIQGDTLEDYTRNIEVAYKNSTSEAMRLKKENDELKAGNAAKPNPEQGEVKPTDLYIQQKMEEEIQEDFNEFSRDYPQLQVEGPEYDSFTREVQAFSRVAFESTGKIPRAKELYQKAVVSLGWEPNTKPTGKESVGIALKKRASISKSSSSTSTKKKVKSKVTQQMIEVNRRMYPGKTDQEIREELEPYI